MARALALAAQLPANAKAHDLLRGMIVVGCALALICAGPALPQLAL